MVVGGTADVVMRQRRWGLDAVDQERLAIQPVLEHRLDMPIRSGAGGARAIAGRIEPLRPVLLREAQQAEPAPAGSPGPQAPQAPQSDKARPAPSGHGGHKTP